MAETTAIRIIYPILQALSDIH
jgi:eukaryotic-like serine/threonine-protein kinase